MLATPKQVVWALITYTDWWQPNTESVYRIGARRGTFASDGIRDGLARHALRARRAVPADAADARERPAPPVAVVPPPAPRPRDRPGAADQQAPVLPTARRRDPEDRRARGSGRSPTPSRPEASASVVVPPPSKRGTPMRSTADLRRRILNRTARIVVIGQGYVGVSLACAAAEAGFSVTGIDVDAPSRRGARRRPAGRRRRRREAGSVGVRDGTARLQHVGRGRRREPPGVHLRADAAARRDARPLATSSAPAPTSPRIWLPDRSWCSSPRPTRAPPRSW